MVQRFFLDWVDTKSGTAPVGRQHDLTAYVLAHETEPAIAFVQTTGTRAQLAEQAAIGKFAPPAARFASIR
jgi:hypothetical protein